MEGQDGIDQGLRVLSYLLSGPLFYGFLGWLVDQWLNTTWCMVVGIVFGMAAGIYLVVRRYGRS
ncbi:MAG: AtpZ/AtpI family protein [Micropruina sp.]|nr:AtpZ/AtpI family protein [Micropruina sp.]